VTCEVRCDAGTTPYAWRGDSKTGRRLEAVHSPVYLMGTRIKYRSYGGCWACKQFFFFPHSPRFCSDRTARSTTQNICGVNGKEKSKASPTPKLLLRLPRVHYLLSNAHCPLAILQWRLKRRPSDAVFPALAGEEKKAKFSLIISH
jgi:hypothetical protein